MSGDAVLIGKAAALERCVARAREELAASANFSADLTRQDAAILNVERACETAIDIAFRLARTKGLGQPTANRDAFDLLARAGIIDAALGDKLKRMVGFRNLATHRYQELNIAVVEAVIRTGLDDLLAFAAIALRT